MPLNTIVRATVKGVMHGAETNNVMHFTTEAGVAPDAPADVAGLIADIIDCLRQTFLPAVSSDWSLVSVGGKTIVPELSDEEIALGIGTDVGALGEGLPTYCAALVGIRTGKGGRSKRGKIFLPGIPEAGQAQSKLTPAQLALVIAYANCLAGKFIGNGGTSDWRLGVWSRKLATANNNAIATSFTEATTLQVSNVLATMHSRKIGVGS